MSPHAAGSFRHRMLLGISPYSAASSGRRTNDMTYDAVRYDGWTLDQIITEAQGQTLAMLKRGTIGALIARREWGGLLVAAAKLVSSREEQIRLFRRIVNLDYSDARRHM